MNSSLIAACLGVIGAGEVLAFLAGRALGDRSARAFHVITFLGAGVLGLALTGAL